MSGCPIDLSASHGPQGLIDEDRVYGGSRHSEVQAALLENPCQDPWGAEGSEPFPVYESSTANASTGFLPGATTSSTFTTRAGATTRTTRPPRSRRARRRGTGRRTGSERCAY